MGEGNVGDRTPPVPAAGPAWTETRDPTRTCGWQPLCTSGVDVVEIDCAHDELFQEPHVARLAAGLDAALTAPRIE